MREPRGASVSGAHDAQTFEPTGASQLIHSTSLNNNVPYNHQAQTQSGPTHMVNQGMNQGLDKHEHHLPTSQNMAFHGTQDKPLPGEGVHKVEPMQERSFMNQGVPGSTMAESSAFSVGAQAPVSTSDAPGTWQRQNFMMDHGRTTPQHESQPQQYTDAMGRSDVVSTNAGPVFSNGTTPGWQTHSSPEVENGQHGVPNHGPGSTGQPGVTSPTKNSHSVDDAIFSCRRCERRFDYLRNFEEHVCHGVIEPLVHSTQSFSCPLCQAVLKNEQNLRRHISIVHGSVQRAFPCPRCTASFSSRGSLKIHQNNAHKAFGDTVEGMIDGPRNVV